MSRSSLVVSISFSILLATVVAAQLSACHPADNLYCDEETPCSKSTQFCDLIGVFQTVRNTCIDKPAEVCFESGECFESANPICGGVEEKGVREDSILIPECRACVAGSDGDNECSTKSVMAPICTNGRCVECRGAAECNDAELPHCDLATGTCVGCALNSECESDVCDIASASCVDEADVVYANAEVGTDSDSCGSRGAPCKTIGDVMGGLSKMGGTRNKLRLQGAAPFAESVMMDNGINATWIGPAMVNPPLDNAPVLEIKGASTVALQRVTLTGAVGNTNADGIRCNTATVTLLQSIVTVNAATGIQADNCALTLDRSEISTNRGGGLEIKDSSFQIRNNFIVSNGTGGSSGSLFGGFLLGTNLATDELSFNTIADNRAINGAAGSGIDCLTPSQMTASSNIVFLGTGAQLRDNCKLTYSNVEGSIPPGEGNISFAPLFVNPGQQDYHLQPGSPCIDKADPAATLTVDVDGDPRPQGARRDIGADEVTP